MHFGSEKHLLFVWKPTGYELYEVDGDPPAVGSMLDVNEQRLQVTKVAPSPLPHDSRSCAYLLPA